MALTKRSGKRASRFFFVCFLITLVVFVAALLLFFHLLEHPLYMIVLYMFPPTMLGIFYLVVTLAMGMHFVVVRVFFEELLPLDFC